MKTEYIGQLQKRLSKLIGEYEREELHEREQGNEDRARYLNRITKKLYEAWVMH